MISDELQELAALHALGMLRGEEAAAFEKQCVENAELAALVQSLRETADSMAFALPPVVPPAALRERVLSGKKNAPAAKVIPFPDKPKPWSGLKVAAIAALAASIPSGLAWYYCDQEKKTRMIYTLAANDARKRQEVDLETIDKLRFANDRWEKVRDQAMELATKLGGDVTKLHADLAMLQSDKDKLLAEVATLQARGLYDQARIALMASTSKPATKATAVSLWDQQAQGGVIVVQNLPALPANRNYQLWVLDDGQPVSAGLLILDGKGGGRIEFKARKPIAKPTLFAVTNETKGEKEAPDLKQLVLAGQ